MSTGTPPPSPVKVLRRIWWLDPQILFVLSTVGTMLIAVLSPVTFFQEYNVPKYVDWIHVGLAAMAAAAFVVGCGMGRCVHSGPLNADVVSPWRLRGWFLFAILLTGAGYAVWIAIAMQNGLSLDLLRRFFMEADDQLFTDIKSDVFVRIPGITTATQFGSAAVLIGLVTWYRGDRWVLFFLGMLLATALLRGLINSERLAFIELALPAFILIFRIKVLGKPAFFLRAWGWRLAPIAALAGLITLFGTAEYFRSWQSHQKRHDSIVEFTLLRFSGYYNLANNNGAMLYEHGWKYPVPYSTLQFFWQFPLVKNSQYGYTEFTGFDSEEQYFKMLHLYANEEMNNDGGLLQPVFDYGLGGLPLFWGLIGIVTGWSYRSFLSGRVAGLVSYPLLVIGILEAPRIMYFTSQRILPSIVLLMAFVALERLHFAGTKPAAPPEPTPEPQAAAAPEPELEPAAAA